MIEVVESLRADTKICLSKEDQNRFDSAIKIYPDSKNRTYSPLALIEVKFESKKHYEYIAISSSPENEQNVSLVSVKIHEQDFFGVKFPLVLNLKTITSFKTNSIKINELNYEKSENFYLRFPMLINQKFQFKGIITVDECDEFYLISNISENKQHTNCYSILPVSEDYNSSNFKKKEQVLFYNSLAKIGQNPTNYQLIRTQKEDGNIHFISHDQFDETIHVFETIISTKLNTMKTFEIISHQIIE